MSITELAKLRQVTSETLRYYDRIGLITPDYVDPQTRYRYYSIRQYEKLGTIKELRQLGMSIHDITDYFSGRNLRKSHQLLLHQLELLEEEIRKQQLLSEILRRKLHFLSEITPPPPVDKVFCRAFPQRYMITFGEPAGGSREHAFAFTRLERYLDEVAPILASDRIGVYAFARLHTYMAEHGWVLNGMIFQFYKIDVTLTSDPDETLMEIQVPVRPAES